MGRAISEVLPFAIGVLLAVRQWRKRPAPGETPEAPKWMSAIDTLTPAKAGGLGVLLSTANPKNLALSLGGSERAAHVLDGWRVWLAAHNTAVMAVLFVVFGSLLFSQGLRGLTA